ncbi:plasmid partitioning protein [Serratia quinivorans]|uniref:ParB/RepB/Spo0J family partition protein n=1 Tax=Serratia TaxID=613 RepID=UPI001F4C138F|nr:MULTISPECIES: ParB/RepB/Spo0J family partition protein [Serratia]ULG18745.1 ParC [Serratia proteamaculans]CAI1223111.1 plasmid partitioning protein [Serratia quinivorans]
MSKTTTKPSAKKTVKTDAAQFVEATLAKAEFKHVMLKDLAATDLNARMTPRTAADIEGRAASIEGAGQLQNLVVYLMADGLYGAAAGETRRLALNLLMDQGRSAAGVPVTPEFSVAVLVVSEDDAHAISIAENVQRSNLEPADQLESFRVMAEKGTSVERIGAILGYSTAHVKKCLKLTTVAPALLELLKTNNINFDQLAALGATDDQPRQIQAWEKGNHYEQYRTPKALRESVLSDEVSAVDSDLVDFVGLDAYQAAGGVTREDLFAESIILTNRLQLETMALAKLQDAADAVAKEEGWAWAQSRSKEVRSWGDDAKVFDVLYAYAKLNDEQDAEIKQLVAEQELLENLPDGGDADDEWEHAPRIGQINARIDEINEHAEINKWSLDVRSAAGVVAYLKDGKIHIQRGLMKMEDIKLVEKAEREKANKETPPSEKGLSQVLVTSLSAERTLAVAASLAQNSTVALALHTFTLTRRIFGKGYCSELHTSVDSQRSNCLNQSADAGSDNGLANETLNALHERWLSRFPQDWGNGFDWLLEWPQEDVLALLAYCVSHGLDGRECQLHDNRVGTKLARVEKALNFQIGDWWKPTSANYFSRIAKDQIVDALKSAGRAGNASDAEGMKRKEAAEFAEAVLKETPWLPACMSPAAPPQAALESAGDVDTDTTPHTDTAADIRAAA